jgi:hypothetical protein
MTLGDAILHAKQRAPRLVPLLRELEIRREGAVALRRLSVLEKRRKALAEALRGSDVVVELTAQIEALRGRMKDLNEKLWRLFGEPPRPVE